MTVDCLNILRCCINWREKRIILQLTVTPSSNYFRLLWLERNKRKTNFFLNQPLCRHFPFRCQPNISCENTTMKWMLSNKLNLITWHIRQIASGYCDWSEVGWKTSFCAPNPFPGLEICFPFWCYPNKLCGNTTLIWMLSNKNPK